MTRPLSCLLEDGNIDLDKLKQATELVQEYRKLCEIANALYDGYFQEIEIVGQVMPPRWAPSQDLAAVGERRVKMEPTDVENLIRNKATVLRDKINELGFSVK